MAKEKKEKTKKSPLLLASIFMTLAMSIGLLAVMALVNPDVTKMLQEVEIFSGEEEEFFTKPIEILAEVNDKNGRKRFVQATIAISSAKEKDIEKLNAQSVKLNDLYIRYLGTKAYEELQTIEGQNKVKEELKDAASKETGYQIKGV